MFGGEYYFDNIKVNPFTYAPMKYGEPLTPLRAYAHDVPRYYMQDFGTRRLPSQFPFLRRVHARCHSGHAIG